MSPCSPFRCFGNKPSGLVGQNSVREESNNLLSHNTPSRTTSTVERIGFWLKRFQEISDKDPEAFTKRTDGLNFAELEEMSKAFKADGLNAYIAELEKGFYSAHHASLQASAYNKMAAFCVVVLALTLLAAGIIGVGFDVCPVMASTVVAKLVAGVSLGGIVGLSTLGALVTRAMGKFHSHLESSQWREIRGMYGRFAEGAAGTSNKLNETSV